MTAYFLPPYTGREQMVHIQRDPGGRAVSGLVTARCGKRFEAATIRPVVRPASNKVVCSICRRSEQPS